jgi:membrane protease YdiL (CAAX protease family)
MSDRQAGLRDRLGATLRASTAVAGFELLVVPLLLWLQAAGLFAKPKLPLLLFGWLSMWLRRVSWRQIGLCRPANWPKTMLAALLIGLAYNALDIGVTLPLLHRITGESLDLGEFAALEGDAGTLLLLIAASWLSAAFIEEMLYRGYLLNRLADIFGRTAVGWVTAAVLTSLTFGLAHHAQGVTGVLDNILAGLLFAFLYLYSGRNLWLPILTHGIIDTSSVLLLYLGYHP